LLSRKPDNVVIGGDLIDWWQFSKFKKNPLERIVSLQDDIVAAHEYLRKWRKIAKNKLIYLEGNHEFRMEKYKYDHPELAFVKEFDVPNILKVHQAGVDKFVRYGPREWTEVKPEEELNPHYVHFPDWHQGFSIITTFKGRESYQVTPVHILPGYKCIVRDVLIGRGGPRELSVV